MLDHNRYNFNNSKILLWNGNLNKDKTGKIN